MQPVHTPVAVASVPSVPYPSLVAELSPSVKELEAFLSGALHYTEGIPLWSTNEANHEPLLHALAEVKGRVQEWKRALSNRLQTRWMQAASEYTQYRQQVDSVLRKRHTAEVLYLFPSSKTAERESQLDPTSLMMMSEEERAVRAHLATLSLGYDKTAEGPSRRVTKLVKKQEKERSVFETTVHAHNEQLAAAKKADLIRLQQELERSDQLLQAIIAAIEGKIAAASKVQASTLYHRNAPRAAPQSPPRSATAVRAPTAPAVPGSAGSARYVGSARSDRSTATQLHSVLPLTSRPLSHDEPVK